MFKNTMNANVVRALLLTAAIAVLAVFSTVPAGAQNKTLSKNELKQLIATAETKAEHVRIATYFDAEAAKYEAEAKEHGETAAIYQNSQASYQNEVMFKHCDGIGKSLARAAEEARALATEHRKMGK
jgi:hypothetical protein